jgi:hypothetical protein
MLESVTEYFKNIFNLQVADGSLAKKCECQIEQSVRHKMHHKLWKGFDKKVCCATKQRQGGDGPHNRQGNRYHLHDYKWQDCNDSGHGSNYDKARRNRRTRLLLIAATRHSSHVLRTDRRASTPPRSATKTPRTSISIKPMTKSISMQCTTTTRITQVMMMSRALAPIHRSQVSTWHQPPAGVKAT